MLSRVPPGFMFHSLLRHRFWTLVLFVIALGGLTTALFELDDIRHEQSVSWDWEVSWFPPSTLPTASAESGVRVRVEVPEATFADELIPIRADSCTITDSASRTQKYPGRSAICVFDEASRTADFTYDIVLYGYQGLITRLAQNGVEAKTLIWFIINNEFPESGDCHPMYGVSITTCPVEDGDELLLFSDDDSTYPPLALTIEDSTILINERARVTVTDARTEGAVSDASVWFGNATVQTDTNGEAVFSSKSSATLDVYAEKDQTIRSRRFPLGIQDVAAVNVTVEERTDVEKNRLVGVTTTLLDDTFLDLATILGAIMVYCEEESYVCRASDAGELVEFRGMSDVVVTKNDRESADLFESVMQGDRVRVALPAADQPAPADDTPPPSEPPSSPLPPSEPPSNELPPSSPPPSPSPDTPEQDAPSLLDPVPVISPAIPPASESPADADTPDRNDQDTASDSEDEEEKTLENNEESAARGNVSGNRAAASVRDVNVALESQEEAEHREEARGETNTPVAFQSDSVEEPREEQSDDRSPLVLGASVEQTGAAWLIVLLLVSSGVAFGTGIRLLRCVVSSGRSA